MKVKHLLGIIVVLLLFLYASFMAFAPMVVQSHFDRHKFTQNVFNITKMKLSFTKAKFYATPSLSIGVKFNDFDIVYSDDKKFLKATHANFEFAALPLLFNKLDFSKIQLENADLELLVLPTREFKVNDYLKTNLNSGLCGYAIKPSVIELTNYKILIPDVRTGRFDDKKGLTYLVSAESASRYISIFSKGQIKTK